MNDVKLHRKIPSLPVRIFSFLQNNSSCSIDFFWGHFGLPGSGSRSSFGSKMWVQYTVETGIKEYLHLGQ
jgi:hypothetical protein